MFFFLSFFYPKTTTTTKTQPKKITDKEREDKRRENGSLGMNEGGLPEKETKTDPSRSLAKPPKHRNQNLQPPMTLLTKCLIGITSRSDNAYLKLAKECHVHRI